MVADLHNHTSRCNHASGAMREYVEAAVKNKTRFFGFSDHAPMNFDTAYRMDLGEVDAYEKDVADLRREYAGKIDILLAYEVDFLDGYIESRVLGADVDYLIGSVHFIDFWGFDNPEYIGEYRGKDLDKIWQDYFDAQEKMVKSGLFNVVGHFDLLKLFKFLPKKDVRLLAKNAIKAIKNSGMAVEINLAGYRKPISEQYPSRALLEEIYASGIDICFGSDAHLPQEVGQNAQKALELARQIGFKKCAVFKGKDKQLVEF